MWSRETLIPGLYANMMYNEKRIKKGWLANIEDYLVGVPRIRLLRVKEGKFITYSMVQKFFDADDHSCTIGGILIRKT